MFLGLSPSVISKPRMVGGSSGPAAPTGEVISLLHFDTGSTTITDVKGKTWTAGGNAIATGTAKFGAYALALDGNGDWIQGNSNAAFVIGTDDFTIEMWLNPATVTGATRYLYDGGSSGLFPRLTILSTGAVRYMDGSGSTATSGAGVLTTGVYQHIAVTRESGLVRVFVGGVNVVQNTLASSLSINGTAFPQIGYQISGTIDEFRLTKGLARYTANFTPPTAAFPDA